MKHIRSRCKKYCTAIFGGIALLYCLCVFTAQTTLKPISPRRDVSFQRYSLASTTPPTTQEKKIQPQYPEPVPQGSSLWALNPQLVPCLLPPTLIGRYTQQNLDVDNPQLLSCKHTDADTMDTIELIFTRTPIDYHQYHPHVISVDKYAIWYFTTTDGTNNTLFNYGLTPALTLSGTNKDDMTQTVRYFLQTQGHPG